MVKSKVTLTLRREFLKYEVFKSEFLRAFALGPTEFELRILDEDKIWFRSDVGANLLMTIRLMIGLFEDTITRSQKKRGRNSRIDQSKIQKAVVLFSGGLDSAVAWRLHRELRRKKYIFLTIDYGQANPREINFAKKLKRKLAPDAPHFVEKVRLKFLEGSSALVVGKKNSQTANKFHVPARNLIFLSLAASLAEAHGAQEIIVGTTLTDSPSRGAIGTSPDTSREFYDSFEDCASAGTKIASGIKVSSPLSQLPKFQVIREAKRLGLDLSKTWTCYFNRRSACGGCNSCRLRVLHYFWAGIQDPTPYEGGFDRALIFALEKLAKRPVPGS